MASKRVVGVAALAMAAAALSGCGHRSEGAFVSQESGSGLSIFGKKSNNAPANASIGVNGYLWRATLDTLAFMPLVSADPWGGTVITDWYSNPEQPNERFKATVYILDTRLRADGLKVTIFKEARAPDGRWVTASTSGQTEIDIQNAILTKARQLRLSNVQGRG
jgi:hypothetical protein